MNMTILLFHDSQTASVLSSIPWLEFKKLHFLVECTAKQQLATRSLSWPGLQFSRKWRQRNINPQLTSRHNAHFSCSSLTLHKGTPLRRAVSCRVYVFWDHHSQLLMTSARLLEVSATGPSEIKSWTFWKAQLKSWSLMAPLTWPTLPAWNLTPFAVTDPSLTLVTFLPGGSSGQTASRQEGRVGDVNFKKGQPSGVICAMLWARSLSFH